jgi:hypothetical protein
MKTRFELEDEIMKLYAFVDNIENAVEFLAESDVDPKVMDTMSNILLGTSTMMGLHVEKMLDTVSQCFKLDQYKEDGVKTWTSEITSPIHHGDMSYDPDSSELSVEVPLTDADNRVTTKSTDRFHANMSGFGYE